MRRFLLLLLLLTLPIAASALALEITVPEGATSLDLTDQASLSEAQAAELIDVLTAHPGVTEVDLTNVRLSAKTQSRLMEACPDVLFLWNVAIGKLTVPSDTTVLDLDALASPSTTFQQVRAGLALLPRVERVIMYKLIYRFDDMQRLLAEHPTVHFDWTIHWNVCTDRLINLRTDATAFSTRKGRQNPRYTAEMVMEKLQYCPDLLAIDLGHNNVSDLTFLQNWPKLRRLIIIDSKTPVTDLSPLAALDDLEYVELFMQNITDISPLANKTKLLDLNLCHNNVTDLSPLYTCTALERLHISYNPNLPQEEVDKLQAALPNCVIETETYQSTGAGWRTHPRYNVIAQSFTDCVYYPFDESKED